MHGAVETTQTITATGSVDLTSSLTLLDTTSGRSNTFTCNW